MKNKELVINHLVRQICFYIRKTQQHKDFYLKKKIINILIVICIFNTWEDTLYIPMFTLIGCIKHVPTELSPQNFK